VKFIIKSFGMTLLGSSCHAAFYFQNAVTHATQFGCTFLVCRLRKNSSCRQISGSHVRLNLL